MGKEAKFGLAVIVILLITFGVVLANRLKGTSGESPTASSDKKEDASSSASAPATSKGTATDKRVLVATKPSVTGTGSRMPDMVNQWNVVSDSDATTSTDSALPAPQPSTYMPDPSNAAAGDRYSPPYAGSSRYGTYDSASQQTPSGSVSGATTTPGTQATGSASDPFYDRSGLSGSTSSTVNVLRPPTASSPSPSSGGIGSATGSGAYSYGNPSPAYGSSHASGGSTPSSPATTSQGSIYSTPAPNTSSSLYGPSTSSMSPSTSPVSTYGSSDPRNENGEYEVQPNDSYWKISQKLYGSGAYFKALVEQNRDRVPREDRLAVGDLISAPTVAELEQAFPDLCPKPSRREAVRSLAQAASMHSSYGGGPTYIVEEGDTLFDIARYELGKASRWSEIHALNRDVLGKDYDYLVPGTRLALPSSESSDTVTSRPGNTSI
ncbi:MAG TPA: LysM peptidoglycan-binding domain-containing protein, partial [Thermoguttaceae bacterium]|nr:LysM peptidoglycan-binding domain-containing protein [Thermoguttaceae bacterium]